MVVKGCCRSINSERRDPLEATTRGPREHITNGLGLKITCYMGSPRDTIFAIISAQNSCNFHLNHKSTAHKITELSAQSSTVKHGKTSSKKNEIQHKKYIYIRMTAFFFNLKTA